MIECVRCGRAVAGGAVCHTCVDTLVDDLGILAWLADELVISETRQARLPGGGVRVERGSPLGFNEAAADALDDLRWMATRWTREFIVVPLAPPVDTVVGMLEWLAGRGAQTLRRHPAVTRLMRDADRHKAAALRVINPVPDEQTYGVCGAVLADGGGTCGRVLYGEPGVGVVRCRGCGAQHDARARTLVLELRLRGAYFRPSTLARILPRFTDRPVSADNIRKWGWEGRAIRFRYDKDGNPEYHVGDVLAVAESTPVRNRGRKAG